MALFIGIALIILIPLYLAVHTVHRYLRRRKLMSTTMPSSLIEIIKRNVAIYRYLPDKLKRELHGHTQIIIAEKFFRGCGGLELTDEIKVTIAAQAAILLLNKENPTYFPKVDSILVYPSTYVAHQTTREGYIETEEESARLGESWSRGVVVIAWDHATQKTLDLVGGHNVVLHEFAHQLDQENIPGGGTPILEHRSSYASWARVMSKEYERLRWKTMHSIRDVMDAYGATNPAEFFAVATETFFEKGRALKNNHPELYDELKSYYKMDPAEWTEQ